MANLNLTPEWDKTFPKSEQVDHKKVTFRNRFGIMLAADMYTPNNAEGMLPAIAVCGSFWSSQGAIIWTLCAGNGGTWLSDNCI